MTTFPVRPIKIGLVSLTAIALLALVAACGGGSDQAQSTGERAQPLALATGPTVSFAPASITMSANPGSKQDIPVVITAGSAMSNVTVTVPAALKPVLSVTPTALGALTAGQAVTVSLKVAPGSSEALRTLAGSITVRAGFATTSKSLPVSLTLIAPESINGIVVPPEPPKQLNDLTLAGFDLNGNGVRDDVERWIAQNFGQSAKKRAALIQNASALQQFMTQSTPQVAATTYLGAATYCLAAAFMSSAGDVAGGAAASAASTSIESQILNTGLRIKAYAVSNSVLGGTVSRSPAFDRAKSYCKISLDTLPN